QRRHRVAADRFLQLRQLRFAGDADLAEGHAARIQELARLAATVAALGGVERHRIVPRRLLDDERQRRVGAIAAAGRAAALLLHARRRRRGRGVGEVGLAGLVGPAVELRRRREGGADEHQCDERAHASVYRGSLSVIGVGRELDQLLGLHAVAADLGRLVAHLAQRLERGFLENAAPRRDANDLHRLDDAVLADEYPRSYRAVELRDIGELGVDERAARYRYRLYVDF